MAKASEMRQMRNVVAESVDGLPTLQQWLDRIAAHGGVLAAAVEGIWCGREGRASLEIDGTRSLLIVGWYEGRVEFAYVS